MSKSIRIPKIATLFQTPIATWSTKVCQTQCWNSGLSYTGDRSDPWRSLFYTDPRRCLVNKSFYDRLKCDDSTYQPIGRENLAHLSSSGTSTYDAIDCNQIQTDREILDRYVAISVINLSIMSQYMLQK